MNSSMPIDVVITWVDGSDTLHLSKINTALTALGFTPRSAAPTRFASNGEIFQCLQSIHKFAPFIRKIFIVTDNQRPDFESQNELESSLLAKIQIIDHSEIFRDYLEYLPTFNSRSIEVMLYRIPDLSEHYIYFNDDVSLIKPVKPSDFFIEGQPILRGKFNRLLSFRIKKWAQNIFSRFTRIKFNAYKNYGFTMSQALAAKLAGYKPNKVFLLVHDPHPLRKSTFENFFNTHPDILEINIRDKFRSDTQFNVAALACHLEIKNGNTQVRSDKTLLYLKPKKYASLSRKLKNASTDPKKLFFCVQSLDKFSDAKQQQITQWLKDQLVKN
jgi:hypothetical protein